MKFAPSLISAAFLLVAAEASAQSYVFRTTMGGADAASAFAGQDTAAADCYDASNVGAVGQAGWTGNCEGMLIVDTAMLRAAASPNVGGNASFEISGPDSTSYTFSNTSNRIFTGQVTDLTDLFHSTNFNGDINYWDTSNVTRMTGTFGSTTNFNRSLNNWDLSKVTSTAYMFFGSSAFNGDISSWDMSAVVEAQYMFSYASAFNQPIGAWDMSEVTSMAYMFLSAAAFNQDISNWNVSKVGNMFSMFRFASSFNRDLSGWCVPLIASKPLFFDGNATAWTQPKPVWGTCA